MTLTRERLSYGLQVAGLATAAVGVLATPFFGLANALQWLAAGVVAVGLDVVSIRTRSDTRAMLAQLGKLTVLLAGIVVIAPPAETAADATLAMVPPDLGPILLLLSVLPSAAGAMVRRTDAAPAVRA